MPSIHDIGGQHYQQSIIGKTGAYRAGDETAPTRASRDLFSQPVALSTSPSKGPAPTISPKATAEANRAFR